MITPKQMNNMISSLPELHKKKAASIEFRKNVIEAQNRDNYNNELHRLQGHLAVYTLPGLQEERLKRHMGSLVEKYNNSYYNKSRGSLYKHDIVRLLG